MNIAIITGASSGLGAEFTKAVEERYRNLNEIWVISRRTERLQELAAKYPDSHIRPFSMDLTNNAAFEELSDLLSAEKPTVRVLVNNAGYCQCGRFDQMEPKAIRKMIDLNISALTAVNQICFPFMKEKSFVVLTCSVSAFVPLMGQAVYSASKAYVMYLGQALHGEMKKRGINVLTLCPGNMDTEMNVRGDKKNEKAGPLPYLNIPNLARETLKRAEAGKGFYTPVFFYKGYRVVSKIVPHYLMMQMTGGVFGEV